jgi:hypothetical protein
MFTTEETKDDFNSTILIMIHVQVIESAIISVRLIAMRVIKEI